MGPFPTRPTARRGAARLGVALRGASWTLAGWAGRGWRFVRSRRLAMVLLLALAGLSALGAALPQQARVGPMAYARWAEANPLLAGLTASLSLDGLYESWWFLGLFGLLYASTLACTLPQLRAAYLCSLRPPALPAGRGRPAHEVPLVDRAPASALADAALALRARRYQVWRRGRALIARKGTLGVWGSPIFHLGLVLILTGAALSGLLGFSGYVEVGEGQGFVDRQEAYVRRSQGPLFDRRLALGPLTLSADGHRGFGLQLDRFSQEGSTWGAGIPSQLTSEVTLLEGSGQVGQATIRLNEPLEYEGRAIYHAGLAGLAPVFQVEQANGSRDTGTVYLAHRGGDRYDNVLYLPGTSYRIAVDAREGSDGVGLGAFERRRSLFEGRVEPGQTVELGEVKLTLLEVRRWAGLRVVSAPGAPVLYAGFGLLVLGLSLSVLVVRREVWAEVVEGAGGSALRLGGHSPKLRALFAAELETLAASLADARESRAATPSPQTGSILARQGAARWTATAPR